MKSDFTGLICPILTPVDEEGRLDEPSFVKLLHTLAERGVDGFYVTGTTGEGGLLPDHVWEAANRVALRELRGTEHKVYSGAVCAGTAGTIELIRRLEDMGAEYAFSTPPFYNSEGSQEQILDHYDKLVRATSVKLIVYSIEFTTHVKVLPRTMAELAKMDRIVGVKDTNADFPTHAENIRVLEGTKMGIATVCEPLIGSALMLGADAVVSALLHFVPEYYAAIFRAAKTKDLDGVLAAHRKIMETDRALGACPGPNGISKMKYLGQLLGFCGPTVSMAASRLTEEQKRILREVTYPFLLKRMEELGAPKY